MASLHIVIPLVICLAIGNCFAIDDFNDEEKKFSLDSVAEVIVSEGGHQSSSLETILLRPRRKVISRGGHYILRSKTRGGGSPWSSSRQAYNYYTLRKKTNRSFPIPMDTPSSRDQSPYSSQTTRRIDTSLLKKATQRKPISKSLKTEIAEFAIKNGAQRASTRYEKDVGRKLKEGAINKMVQRYHKRRRKTNK